PEARRAPKRPGPPAEGPCEAKRGPGCAGRPGDSGEPPGPEQAREPRRPPTRAFRGTWHARDRSPPGPPALAADWHGLAGDRPAGVGNGGGPWPGEPPGTPNGHSHERTPPGPPPAGPCPAKRRLVPAEEGPDAGPWDEGPTSRRHRGPPPGPAQPGRGSDAKAATFWNRLLPAGAGEALRSPADSSPTGRRPKGARCLKPRSPHGPRKGPSPPGSPRPAVSRPLLGNFEESLLRGRFPPSGHIEGFTAEIGASGSYCPPHVTLPVSVTFFDVSEHGAPAPFLGVADLTPLGRKGYGVPKAGTVQVTLFNPNQTVVKMFLVTFDFSDMPAAHVTFLRHRLFLVPVGERDGAGPARGLLCYLLHLRFRSSRSGRLYLHGDLRLLFSRRSLEVDTGLPYELQALTEAPRHPRYSPLP
ncbi:protein FAM214B, partial [Tachyglossus aculeatus]|uniref:protein FAM214B n=1 Tax=Tachyglossus aculeatus TaxID=9261 RepID=UPI0018F4C74A